MQYENNKDARVLDNKIFTCRRTHVALSTEHKEENDALCANSNQNHILYTRQNFIRDMRALKDTLKISQVNEYYQPHTDGNWHVGSAHLPYSCPNCRAQPSNIDGCIFKNERQWRKDLVKQISEKKIVQMIHLVSMDLPIIN